MERITENLIILFFKKWGIYDSVLKRNTVINTIDQDFLDLEMVFEQFFKKFDITNSEEFDVNKYFYKISFFNRVCRKLGFAVKLEQKPEITINHMIDVVNKKEWFDCF